ncbi:MAG TPA: SseB family protein [Trebonia sp.]|nr:SseB family protein [Trebonia sp.]
MLPNDPATGPGSSLPGGQPSVPSEVAPHARHRGPAAPTVAPPPPRASVPPQLIAHGGAIIRPGAVAWGGTRDTREGDYSSFEAIERTLAATARNPAELPLLLTELVVARLWVPLPVRHRPFTDGAAVRLPLIGYQDTDFVPCFTSVQRLTAWVDQGGAWQRAGDPRIAPHVVVPAGGLAQRLPAGLGLAINPDTPTGLPIYPECVPYLARLAMRETAAAAGAGTAGTRQADSETAPGGLALGQVVHGSGVDFLIGHPPAEPSALLAETRSALRALPPVRQASRAWLSAPGEGEGLVISVVLDEPAREDSRAAAAKAIERAAASVALRVPFPLDITFPGERVRGDDLPAALAPLAAIDAWIEVSTRPFYARDVPA